MSNENTEITPVETERQLTLTSKPKWMRDIQTLLPIRAQFILSGNIRDGVTFEINDNAVIYPFNQALNYLLDELGYDAMLTWDIVDGLSIECEDEEIKKCILSSLNTNEGSLNSITIEQLGGVIQTISSPPDDAPYRAALIIDFASRIPDEGRFIDVIKRVYVHAEKAARNATQLVTQNSLSFYNPVFWLLNRPGDAPFWFSLDNNKIHSLNVPIPDIDSRKEALAFLYEGLPENLRSSLSKEGFSEAGSALTHNMPIFALTSVVTLMKQMNIQASDIDDAIQCYRIGDLNMDNPWRSEILKSSIQNGFESLQDRVKGQNKAINRVLDVLKRTSVGLTGAQANSSATRPRGILFFAGPTGVGKTELAKSITKLIFGNDSAYKRFDMSEFSAEHSADRLIGAPPGYTGFDQGGELTNAMLENPFRVLLFDEIEKANDRILDKFLQILEDGRLTDGQGRTAFFSDALIIFTSNAGMTQRNADGSTSYKVTPEFCANKPQEYEDSVINGIRDFFINGLERPRPELLNRMGENIIAFNFISPSAGASILEGMMNAVIKRVDDEHSVTLKITPQAQEQLEELCLSNLEMGGRGIGSKLEAVFINPLARTLFDSMPDCNTTLSITDLNSSDDGVYELVTD